MAGLPAFLDVEERNHYILEKCEEPMPEGQIRLRLEKKLAGVQGIGATLEHFASLKEGHEDKTSSALLTRLKERAAAYQEKEEEKRKAAAARRTRHPEEPSPWPLRGCWSGPRRGEEEAREGLPWQGRQGRQRWQG